MNDRSETEMKTVHPEREEFVVSVTSRTQTLEAKAVEDTTSVDVKWQVAAPGFLRFMASGRAI